MIDEELKRKAARAVRFDLMRLDEEWVDQPVLFHEFACLLADANHEVDLAKANLELIEAEMDREIRTNPTRFHIEKVTEGTVTAAVRISKRYQDAQRKLIDLRHEAAYFKATVEALEHRKKGLESAVYLANADYFSNPRLRGEGTKGERMREVERAAVRVGEKRPPKEGSR